MDKTDEFISSEVFAGTGSFSGIYKAGGERLISATELLNDFCTGLYG